MRMRGCGVSANEYSCAHGAQINFGDFTPYLTYRNISGKSQQIFSLRTFLNLTRSKKIIGTQTQYLVEALSDVKQVIAFYCRQDTVAWRNLRLFYQKNVLQWSDSFKSLSCSQIDV
jgi:hypothetical protein